MAIDVVAARGIIDTILAGYHAATSAPSPLSLLPTRVQVGKLYEAWVLAVVLRELANQEGYRPILKGSTRPTLHMAPGPINRQYPYFELVRGGRAELDVWTDVEFLTLSYGQQSSGRAPAHGDYHELDIVAVPAGTGGRPAHHEIRIGVECKATSYGKNLLREILGVRRELSLLQAPSPTGFWKWPRFDVPADPPSCLLVFSTDPSVLNYRNPGARFGIDFFHELPPQVP